MIVKIDEVFGVYEGLVTAVKSGHWRALLRYFEYAEAVEMDAMVEGDRVDFPKHQGRVQVYRSLKNLGHAAPEKLEELREEREKRRKEKADGDQRQQGPREVA